MKRNMYNLCLPVLRLLLLLFFVALILICTSSCLLIEQTNKQKQEKEKIWKPTCHPRVYDCTTVVALLIFWYFFCCCQAGKGTNEQNADLDRFGCPPPRLVHSPRSAGTRRPPQSDSFSATRNECGTSSHGRFSE